jgi:hypothetical protein
MTSVITPLAPLFKDRGYRKRGNSFNRTVSNGLIHVVNFQMGAFNPPGTVEIPGLRPNLYGTFTLNLGVYLHDIERQKGAEESVKKFIPEYQCHIRTRIGNLLPDGSDTWWRLDQPVEVLIDTVRGAMLDHGFAWLAQFETLDQSLDCLEGVSDPASNAIFLGSPRLTAMRIRLSRGEHDRAERDFVEHVEGFAGSGRRSPGHLESLAKIAQSEGFDVNVVAVADSARPTT